MLYVLVPLALRPKTPRYVLGKVHRWTIHLSRFDFEIQHIQAVKTVFADSLTRWSKGHRVRIAACGNVIFLYHWIVPSSMGLKDITKNELSDTQRKYNPPNNADINTEGIWPRKGKTWMPGEENDIKLRILIAAHCRNN